MRHDFGEAAMNRIAERRPREGGGAHPPAFALDPVRLFWIFTFGSVLGLVLETVFCAVYYGSYQDRAGLLFGPFSPIYGVGAVLMTLSLNRFAHRNIALIFLIGALVGGAFEYFASCFMEVVFGVVAWDYTGMLLSIGGRTCGLFMAIWGVLGVVWVRLLLPLLMRAIDAVPQPWLTRITVACSALMAVDVIMTLIALECWQERVSGIPETIPLQHFFAEHFDNDFMRSRFQTMEILYPET